MSEPAGKEAVQPPAVKEGIQSPPVSAESAQAPPAQSKSDAKDAKPTEGDAPKKLSAIELKRQKAAMKQARRAQEKSAGPPGAQQGPQAKDGSKQQQKGSKPAPKDDKSKPLPVRSRPSHSNTALPQPRKEAKEDPKQVGLFFGHLYSQPRKHSMVGTSKDVHPAILALGLQYSSYTVCGSTARMMAMLLAFKALIASYQTPVGTSLSRHLVQLLGPQIDYLRDCRPYSISMGNAIRWLKDSMFMFLHSDDFKAQFLSCNSHMDAYEHSHCKNRPIYPRV